MSERSANIARVVIKFHEPLKMVATDHIVEGINKKIYAICLMLFGNENSVLLETWK